MSKGARVRMILRVSFSLFWLKGSDMTQHTQGEWKVDENDFTIIRTDDESEAIVCQLCPDLNNGEYDYIKKAQANLIAAAPKLLEALELANRVLTNRGVLIHQQDQGKINAAIAAAKGEA